MNDSALNVQVASRKKLIVIFYHKSGEKSRYPPHGGSLGQPGFVLSRVAGYFVRDYDTKARQKYAIYSVFCKCCDTISVNVRGCRADGNSLC